MIVTYALIFAFACFGIGQLFCLLLKDLRQFFEFWAK